MDICQWEPSYIRNYQPSIAYLELYALCTGISVWQEKLKNMRFIIFCDNESVVSIVNLGVSSCKNCMFLLQLLTLNNLLFYRRIFVKHLKSKQNYLADFLSHLKLNAFFQTALLNTKDFPEELPMQLWPTSKLWFE